MLRSRFAPTLWTALAITAVACGTPARPAATFTSGTGGAGGMGGASEVSSSSGLDFVSSSSTGGADGCGGGPGLGSPSTTYPGPHPKTPKVFDYGGPVLASPRIVPVYFANDDAWITGQLTQFLGALVASQYWNATTSEYGVGPLTVTAPVQLTEAAPATLTDADIRSWLAAKLEANDPAWPAPDENTIYVLDYPSSTTISADWSGGTFVTCMNMGGYHESITLDAAHMSASVAYAVIPRCSNLDTATVATSHELIEAATDPFSSHPAYAEVDEAHFYWGTYLAASEVGDMCALRWDAITKATDVPYAVQRTWSNAAALATHDPCVPVPTGDVYFNAAPVLPDHKILMVYGSPLDVPTVNVEPGSTRTIDVQLFSDGDTQGPWSVDVQDLGSLVGAPPMNLTLDACGGQNGQTMHLTIGVDAPSPTGYSLFLVTSSLGAQEYTWLGIVAN